MRKRLGMLKFFYGRHSVPTDETFGRGDAEKYLQSHLTLSIAVLVAEPGDDLGETSGRGGDLGGGLRQVRGHRSVGLGILRQPLEDVADPIQAAVQDRTEGAQLRQALRLVLHRLGPELTELPHLLAPLGQLPLTLLEESGWLLGTSGAGMGLVRGGGNVAVLNGVSGNVGVLLNGGGM